MLCDFLLFVKQEDEGDTPKRSKKDSYIVPSLEDEDDLPWTMYARQKSRKEEVLEEDDEENESTDSESGDENYGNTRFPVLNVFFPSAPVLYPLFLGALGTNGLIKYVIPL